MSAFNRAHKISDLICCDFNTIRQWPKTHSIHLVLVFAVTTSTPFFYTIRQWPSSDVRLQTGKQNRQTYRQSKQAIASLGVCAVTLNVRLVIAVIPVVHTVAKLATDNLVAVLR